MTPIATYTSYPLVINIYAIANTGSETYVTWGFADEKKLHNTKLYMTRDGAYFKVRNQRISLNNCLRTEIGGKL